MNISFSRLGNYGRLGNSLFQIASCMGLAHNYKASLSFPEWKYEKYFANPLPHGKMNQHQIKENQFNYHEWNLKGDTDILGYLQSERYFENIKDKIKEQFTFKPEFVQSAKDKLGVFDKETILLQVRRTDYVNCPTYYQLPVTYYIQALNEFFPNWQDMNLIFISDDIPYCRVHFEFLPNAFFADVIDIEQIAIAGLCDHYIIANSSFGWWSAWLGEKPHSKIIHPGRLHDGEFLKKTNEKDYWPERWTNFKKDSYKLDLRDTTFTIPVFCDHTDRKQNLDLSVCILQKNLDTNIIVGEQGGNKFTYMTNFCEYMAFDLKYFHRTKMLNDMAFHADTPYIANWDADVIIPPFQIYMAVEKLRKGADMVFPYDGRFARLERNWFKEIEKILDIGTIGDTEPKGKRGQPVPETSVGGAVFFNKESFIDGGMENENMISFGPEDCERNDRFTRLGFKVERVGTDENNNCGKGLGGCLYHINHWCGPDSSSRNPHFRKNQAELEKIRKMTREELRLYVDSFSWRHIYTEAYYKRISEGSIRSAEEIYKELFPDYMNKKIIDVGCGVGEFCCGNPNYIGVDYNIPKKSLLIPIENYINCDLEKDVVKFDDKFDLCLCLEVAEHISEARADALVEMLCSLSDKVLFSAAIPMQGGTGHVNEQWQTWWAEKFYLNDFLPAEFQPEIRNNDRIEFWYKQNIVLYEKFVKGKAYGTVNDFVLPEYYEKIVTHLKQVQAA